MRSMGFDAIFDTNFGADMTIVEEANEFVKRFTESKGTAVMTTSCCPAWVKYIEEYYPDLLDNVSTAKSPHMMLAPMTKTYYAEKMKLNPAKIYNVSNPYNLVHPVWLRIEIQIHMFYSPSTPLHIAGYRIKSPGHALLQIRKKND